MERNLIFNEINSINFNSNFDNEVKPTLISKSNTDLDAPYKSGNFNFLYNGGNEAIVTFNAYYRFRKGIDEPTQISFKQKMFKAIEYWNKSAKLEIMDGKGTYSKSITFIFKLEEVKDKNNANKVVDIHRQNQRFAILGPKNTGVVLRDVNVPLHFSAKDLAHELGHVWGLLGQYKRPFKIIGHVGRNSPLINDTKSLMHEDKKGIEDIEFRTWFFKHIARTVLTSFKNVENYRKYIKNPNTGKNVAYSITGSIKLLKKSIYGDLPYTIDMDYNPVDENIRVAYKL